MGRGRGPSRAKERGGRTFVGGEQREGKGKRARKEGDVELVREAEGQERKALQAPASRDVAEDPRRERPAERPVRPRGDLQVLPRHERCRRTRTSQKAFWDARGPNAHVAGDDSLRLAEAKVVASIEAYERIDRAKTKWFGGVDCHHVFFEGIFPNATKDAYGICWGS